MLAQLALEIQATSGKLLRDFNAALEKHEGVRQVHYSELSCPVNVGIGGSFQPLETVDVAAPRGCREVRHVAPDVRVRRRRLLGLVA